MTNPELIKTIQSLELRVSQLESLLKVSSTKLPTNTISDTVGNNQTQNKFTPLSPSQVEALIGWREKYSSILSEFDDKFLGTVITYKQVSPKQEKVLAGIKEKIRDFKNPKAVFFRG